MMPTLHARPGTWPALVLVIAVLVAACSAAGSSPAVPGSSPPGTAAPSPAPTDGNTVTSPPDTPGNGTVTSPPGGPIGSTIPGPQPTMLTPAQGLLGIRPVGASAIEPQVSGGEIVVRLSWWSGPAPCSVLAGVDIARDATTFTLTIREGAAQQGVACPEIAMLKATLVDLGSPGPATYTIVAFGQVPPARVTVPG